MIKKMGLIALTASMMLLSGCGSSNDTTNTETTSTGTTSTETTTPVFTKELVVGKTYTVLGDGTDLTVSFSQTEISFVANGESGIVSYSIDSDGTMFVNTPDGQSTYTLISKEANGDLNVLENDKNKLIWVLIS